MKYEHIKNLHPLLISACSDNNNYKSCRAINDALHNIDKNSKISIDTTKNAIFYNFLIVNINFAISRTERWNATQTNEVMDTIVEKINKMYDKNV